jgi:hypothetical protein
MWRGFYAPDSKGTIGAKKRIRPLGKSCFFKSVKTHDFWGRLLAENPVFPQGRRRGPARQEFLIPDIRVQDRLFALTSSEQI